MLMGSPFPHIGAGALFHKVAALDEGARTLVLISTVFGVGREVAHDLSGFAQADGPVVRWQTGASRGGDR